MDTIKKTIDINASREKVWEVLFSPETYSEWAHEFSDGASVDTDWEQGSEVIFTDGDKNGLIGTISQNVQPEFLSITYRGAIVDGVEDYVSNTAVNMRDGVESYSLTEKDLGNGENKMGTHLEIESDITEEYVVKMNAAWDRALQKVKELAEKVS